MHYQVLARKWRPSNFSEVVGQDHVVISLVNALQHNRLHHAYLFTGTRGVGKTTLARILAKALNCESLQAFNPCGRCHVCRAVDEGRLPDLIEIDAASRTKVEDTRDLLDNVQYAPHQGRYKIYLIDEVHMLSGHSFNALLKTLEEPPPHVKFLLATTDPQKIPVTVLSRCLQFNLKRLPPERIFGQMETILSREEIDFEPAALTLLARAADGSMRDGLSLLDQAIVYGGGRVQTEAICAMLGTISRQPVEELLFRLAAGDGSALLAKIAEIADLQADFGGVLQQILQVLHRIALMQQWPRVAFNDFDNGKIRELAAQLAPEDVQLFYQIGLLGQRDLELAPDAKSGFEMIMLRMLVFKPQDAENRPALAPAATTAAPVPRPAASAIKASLPIADIPPAPAAAFQPLAPTDWGDIVKAMNLNGLTRELANNCILKSLDDTVCALVLGSNHRHLLGGKAQENLQKALRDYYRAPLKLMITAGALDVETPAMRLAKAKDNRQQAAVAAIESDETVQALQERFGARIIPGTIEPT